MIKSMMRKDLYLLLYLETSAKNQNYFFQCLVSVSFYSKSTRFLRFLTHEGEHKNKFCI